MKQISIEEVRNSLVEQIKVKLNKCDGKYYYFEEYLNECFLVSGQWVPCAGVKLKENGVLVFDVTIINVHDIEVGYNDLMVESLQNILDAIPFEVHKLEIKACQISSAEVMTVLEKELSYLPSGDECYSILDDFLGAGWVREEDDPYQYYKYPNTEDDKHWLSAYFS